MYEKILVPIDGSEYSIRALCEAINVAKLTGGAITLIHVTPTGSSVVVSSKQHFYDMLHDTGRTVLSDRLKLAKEEGVKTGTLLVQGDPVDQIVKTAKQGNFGLIVMGARGVSKLAGLIVGSVSQGVIKNAPCPVLITR
ncbi:MAG: universal stress protein [Candidatus Bathyarchaeota archaeon]|nr:universal stress protein [Candidatus Bathyarchaeota archaeon]